MNNVNISNNFKEFEKNKECNLTKNDVKELCNRKYDNIYNFVEGYAIVKKFDKYGFISEKGKEICDLKYDVVNNFHNGFAPVELGGKWGFINMKGKETCDLKYDYITDYQGEFSAVKIKKILLL